MKVCNMFCKVLILTPIYYHIYLAIRLDLLLSSLHPLTNNYDSIYVNQPCINYAIIWIVPFKTIKKIDIYKSVLNCLGGKSISLVAKEMTIYNMSAEAILMRCRTKFLLKKKIEEKKNIFLGLFWERKTCTPQLNYTKLIDLFRVIFSRNSVL